MECVHYWMLKSKLVNGTYPAYCCKCGQNREFAFDDGEDNMKTWPLNRKSRKIVAVKEKPHV